MGLLGAPPISCMAARHGGGRNCRAANWLMCKMFGTTGWLILSHQTRLWRHAFPTKPIFRALHHVAFALVLWTTIAAPACLFAYSTTLVPELNSIEIIGGSLIPPFDPKHRKYTVMVDLALQATYMVMRCRPDTLLTTSVTIKCPNDFKDLHHVPMAW